MDQFQPSARTEKLNPEGSWEAEGKEEQMLDLGQTTKGTGLYQRPANISCGETNSKCFRLCRLQFEIITLALQNQF